MEQGSSRNNGSGPLRWTWVSLILAGLLAGAAVLMLVQSGGRGRVPATLRVGYSPEPPYSFRAPDGRVTGESPEVARMVLNRLGKERVDWVQTDFGLLIPELLAGRIDMIAAGMFITPDRARLVAFSKPTLSLSQSLLVLEGNPKEIHRYEDFATRSELTLGVLGGALERPMALSLRVPAERIVVFPDVQTGMVALSSGAVDGFALSSPTVRRLRDTFTRAHLEVPVPFHEPKRNGEPIRSYAAFAFRPADVALKAEVDAALDGFVGSTDHLSLLGRMGFSAADLPDSAVNAQSLPTP